MMTMHKRRRTGERTTRVDQRQSSGEEKQRTIAILANDRTKDGNAKATTNERTTNDDQRSSSGDEKQ